MTRRLAVFGLGVALVACSAGAPSPGSPTLGQPDVPSTTPTSSASAEPLDLNGTILIGLDTMYIGDASATELEPLFPTGAYGGIFRISPDRTQILTLPGNEEVGNVTPPPVPPDIVVQGGLLDIASGRFTIFPQPDPTLTLVPQVFSPDGSRIVCEGWDESDPSRTGLYTARTSDLGGLVRVTNRPGLPHDIPLDISPDGTMIVFYRSPVAEPDPTDIGGSLWVVNVDGTHLTKLDTGDASPWWWARWSPDGSTIVFGSERLKPSGPLWTIKPDGTGLTKVYEDPAGGYVVGPVWSPDGSQIMFALNPHNDWFQHPQNSIYVVDADGSDPRLVIGGAYYKGITEWWR